MSGESWLHKDLREGGKTEAGEWKRERRRRNR